jgi:hypothetical protein
MGNKDIILSPIKFTKQFLPWDLGLGTWFQSQVPSNAWSVLCRQTDSRRFVEWVSE